jgi:hypothetical protein
MRSELLLSVRRPAPLGVVAARIVSNLAARWQVASLPGQHDGLHRQRR